MRKFLKLSYNGSPFHGWQSQPNATSVQQTIEDALSTILRHKVSITGAGRTDTGVNARTMYAHFDTSRELDAQRLLTGLNKLCGPAIAIHDIIDVHDDAHARFDAVSRTYKYFITFEKTVFLDKVSWHCTSILDVEMMNNASTKLLAENDFTSFAKLHSDAKTNICDVTEAHWSEWHNDYGIPGIVFTISANRFLRNMVRAVVGTLVEVGRGKMTLKEFSNVIKKRDRCAAGASVPPQALFLWDIQYPDNIWIP